MKNVKINFSIFFAAFALSPLAAFSQTDYYFNPESAGQTKFFSGSAWTYDAAGAERASSAPLSTDTAYILNKAGDKVSLELDTVDAYVGELVIAGNAQNAAMVVFGNAALDNTATFEVDGSIKSLVGPTSQNYFSFPPLHPPSLSYGTLLPSSRSFATRDRSYFALNSIHSLSIRTTTKSSSITAYGVPRSLLKFASPSFRGTPSSAYDVVY